jgi:hypothetical protein
MLILHSNIEAGKLRKVISIFNKLESKVNALVASIMYAISLNLH